MLLTSRSHFLYFRRTGGQQGLLYIESHDILRANTLNLNDTHKRALVAAFLVVPLVVSMIFLSSATSAFSPKSVSTSGIVNYWPQVDVSVNPSRVLGINNLSLGHMLEFDWSSWRDNAGLRQLTQNAGFRLIRIFSHRVETCTHWDDSAGSGSFVWSQVDLLIQRIFDVGAEPLICLGYCAFGSIILPPGMTLNSTSGLPFQASWAAYCQEWVKHFEQTGKNIRFYEILNEPWMYFGWNDYAKIANYMGVFNAAALAMRTENPNVLLGFDGANRKPVLNYWLSHGGAELGFISFHKYDSGAIGQYSDAQIFARAEQFQMTTDPGGPESGYYGIDGARQMYYSSRGKQVLIINSESNFDSAWSSGTDPKMQQMAGAVWLALALRTGVVDGLDYNVYFTFSSSRSWETSNKPSGGAGFGMINSDNSKPWYPYYVQSMLGQALHSGDAIVESNSSSDDVRVLSWIHDNTTNILLICKVDQTRAVDIVGQFNQFNATWVDNTVSWLTPETQSNSINPRHSIIVNGYTVLLLQST